MSYDNVKFKEEARSGIISGINCAVDAIQTTFGPNGNNVLIKSSEGVKSTKDGKTVVTSINLPNPYEQIGVELISEASKHMADTVGDASSTVGILARQLIEQFKGHPNAIQLFRELNTYKENLLKVLKSEKHRVSSKKDLVRVASVSANNDTTIGKMVADAYDKVGLDGIVQYEAGEEAFDTLEYIKGFKIESGYLNQGFVNSSKNTCELTNVLVHISDLKMENIKEVMSLCEKAMQEKKSLLLIAPEFDSEVTIFLKSNLNLLKSCCILTPNFRIYRQIAAEDIADILGETMTCKKVICDAKTTTFIGYESNQYSVNKKVAEIKERIKNKAYNEFDLAFNKKRLANFTSGIAIIHVGGFSEIERGNRMDLFEDSILATRQALLGGYIGGGGTGLAEAANKLLSGTSCSTTLFDFVDSMKFISRLLHHEDITSNEMIKKGILEPVLITKEYINTAFSIANQVLACDCAIINNNLFFND